MGFPVSQDWRTALAAVPEGGLALFSPARGTLAMRRAARALMEDAAVLGGGQVLALPGGDLLLGAQAAPGHRAGRVIAELTGQAPESWILPAGREAAEARCRDAPPAAPVPSLAELEARCAAMAVPDFARLTLFAEGTGGRAAAQRLGPAQLGLPDPELESLAREWFCGRLLAVLADPAQRGLLPALRPGLRLILDLPRGGLPGGLSTGAPWRGAAPDDPNRPIALLPLSSRADPARFAAIEAGLRAAGWTVGLAAADARALDWVEAPGLAWAVPAGEMAPRHWPELLIALGPDVPGWCRGPGILREGIGP
ncbi:hypothetical protein EJV46_09440 [Roseococcus sp. SYP-B2431]|uniref:hypothetical protein n=1 Tax=Roseococcus sp. SYP-B2431 TaxID=2496640 RepID=UPI001039EFE7|nr:hypothetical protein [Roseococcus sp. SYP-B2431]TCH98780.1 hypothetical protein EJV46_09440 [Roseococcus sp. SYP-B2431]